LASESDPLAVGRELGKELNARMRRQARSQSTVGGDQPQVTPVAEYDAVVVDIRKAKELRLRTGWQAEGK
jgi:hypothetical protein